jgi:hypothetical protein
MMTRIGLLALHELEPGPHLFSGVTYADDQPRLTIDAVTGPIVRREAAVGHAPAYLALTAARFCRGYWQLDTLTSYACPERAPAPRGFCFACQRRTGFNPAFYNASVETLSPQQRRYNAQPHAVYLAAFADDLIKVGISHVERLRSRWLEQGARAGMVLTLADNASAARAVEAAAVGQMGIVERVPTARKIALLRKPFDQGLIEARLSQFCERLSRALKFDRDDWPVNWLDDVYFQEGVPDLSRLAEMASAPDHLGGVWHGVVGAIACIENPGGLVAQDLSAAFGHRFEGARGLPATSAAIKPFQAQLF